MYRVVVERRQHHNGQHYKKAPKDLKCIEVGLEAITQLVVWVVVLIGLFDVNCRVAILVVGGKTCTLKLDTILVENPVELLVLLVILFFH
jgi:hypothetical protein